MVEKSPDAARAASAIKPSASSAPSGGTGPKPSFSFGTNNASNQTVTGLNIGFGIKKDGQDLMLAPISIKPYIVTLAKSNPKAYSNIQKAVYAASGKNIKDPNTLGAWVGRLAENIFYSQDPLVKTGSIEDFLRDTAKAANVANAASVIAGQPQRQIYEYKEADRQKWIDDVSLNLRGQSITEDDKNTKWYQDLKASIDAMVQQGTTTRTQKSILNTKTGKMETRSITTPGFSQDQAAAEAEKVIRAATPEDVSRKERVDFTSWMFKALGGANG